MPLNPRQLLFVENYLVDLNGKAAAIRAGYGAKGAAARAAKLLSRPAIRAAVAAAMAARAARSSGFFPGGITAERVLAEYAAIAFADYRHFAAWGPRGARLFGAAELSAAETCAIAELADAKPGGLRRLKLFDKLAALNSLQRILAYGGAARFRAASTEAIAVAAPPAPLSNGPSPRQQRFADEYLAGFNAHRAALAAGYAPTSAPFLAWKIKRYPQIAPLLAAGIAAQRASIRADADRVLAEYAAIAFADIARIADWDEEGLRFHDERRVTAADSAAIQSAGCVGTRSGAGGTRLRLHDKVYALDALARHLGLLEPRMPGRLPAQSWSMRMTSAALRGRR